MNSALQVMKFGGTSVGDATCIARTAQIVAKAARETPCVVVVSAMSGVTNRLIEAARKAATGDSTEGGNLTNVLRSQHAAAVETLIQEPQERECVMQKLDGVLTEAKRLCDGTALLRELTPRTLDEISSLGERLSAPIVAAAVASLGLRCESIDATELIVTDAFHGGAKPHMERTRQKAQARLRPLLTQGIVPVVTGFIGATADGKLTTLGRGGSDYSATILGAALDASEVIIWTDVNGVLTADPRMVPDAVTLDEVSYTEAGELAFFGAKVLHPMTLRPVIESGIPVWIRNSFEPHKAGTKITQKARPTLHCVKAVTATRDVALIAVAGPGIIGVPDIAARIFAATASVRANIVMISQSSSQESICFVIQAGDAVRTEKALREALHEDVRHHDLDHVTVNRNVAVVAAVGENMAGTPGIAGRVFTPVGHEGTKQ